MTGGCGVTDGEWHEHRKREQADAARILLAAGWPLPRVAELLLLHPYTVRRRVGLGVGPGAAPARIAEPAHPAGFPGGASAENRPGEGAGI